MERLVAQDVGNWLAQQLAGGSGHGMLRCIVDLPCHWLAGAPEQVFALQVEYAREDAAMRLRSASFAALACAPGEEASWPDAGDFMRLRLDRPLLLERVHIPKPWGQEIWYTGVEERGVCGFRAERGAVPIPWVLETLSGYLTAGRRQLVLLKILDPLPEEVWGDLYFELHEEKQEIYVVTHVDEAAWPDGVGAIRFGFDPARVAEYDSEDAFRAAFRDSVARYERVRREIDAELDIKRERQGIALDAAVSPQQLTSWQSELPSGLMQRERDLRAEMEAFSLFRPLRLGDVVKVPCYTPHSLQHGVRTVEFQTPVYERKIVSFAQKVLTQGHWDTDEAIELMALTPAQQEDFSVVDSGPGFVAERIVDFDDFEVQRWRLQPGSRCALPAIRHYAMVMAIDAAVDLGDCILPAEQACLVSAMMSAASVTNAGDRPATVLVATPAPGEAA